MIGGIITITLFVLVFGPGLQACVRWWNRNRQKGWAIMFPNGFSNDGFFKFCGVLIIAGVVLDEAIRGIIYIIHHTQVLWVP